MTKAIPVVEQKSPRGYVPTRALTSTNELPVLLSTKQVAALLGVSVRHVLNLLERGEIKAVKLGSCWRVSRDYLLAYCGLA